ncbi:urease accessory protein UreD [Domibacillus sp. A3M-37]|uniref:urease accessory protein UreD n=1 Tax=Domibacillus sp. A3M-37 TaxID=2962037 RepID=UPI0020B68282|nr:urease accessory protein UreD [Domibacillus sp. A3M-37]MCP3762978.1 urease accessory protein UreD [Domibacillus sp. A3M-37]
MRMTGTLRMKAVCRGEKTVVADTYFDGAFKVARPVYFQENEPTVYSLHVGGGYIGGDRYHTDVVLEQDARMTLTTQSAAKVYKTPNAPVHQSMTISLAQGSVFMYLPDPLIAYEQARFQQETVIHMEKGSTLLYSDSMTPGWSKSGDPFRYDWIRSKVKIYEDDSLQAYDHLFLKPEERDLFSLMQMEGYTHVGSLFIVSPMLQKDWQEALGRLLESYNEQARIGFSTLKNGGCTIRILANASYVIENIILQCTNWMRSKLDQEPVQLRKY